MDAVYVLLLFCLKSSKGNTIKSSHFLKSLCSNSFLLANLTSSIFSQAEGWFPVLDTSYGGKNIVNLFWGL